MPRFLNRQQAVLTDSQHYTTKISQEQLTEAETSNTKLDTANTNLVALKTQQDGVIGAINNTTIGDGTLGQRTYVYAHDVSNGQAKALKCDAAGRLECSVDALEVTAETINLNTDTMEAKLQAISDGQTQNGNGTGNKPGVILDAINTNTITGNSKLDTIITNTAAASSAGTATEAKQDTQITHLSEIEGAVEAVELTVGTNTATAPTRSLQIGGKYVDGTFRDIKVDNIGKVIVDSPSGSDINLNLVAISNGQTQDGAGGGNKPGVMLDAVNTNIISLNNKFVGGQTTSGMATAANQQVVDLTLQGIDTIVGNMENAQTQDGAGGGNKLGVMIDAINTNTITGNGKLDTLETSNQLINTTTSSRLATVNTSVLAVASAQTQDGAGGGNKPGVMLDAINTNTITGNGKLDTLITSNAALTIANHADLVALEASLTAMEGKQDTIITHLSEIEGAAETIETAYGLSKCNINISSDAVGLATQTTLAAAEAHLGNIDTGVDVLEACVGSNKVNVNIASNAVDFATQTTLAAAEAHLGNIDTGVDVLEACVGSNKVNVNIASNAVDFATQTTLAAAEAHLGNIDTGVDVLEACVGSNKVNVNIASNAVDFATQTTLAAAEAHLGNIETAVQLIDDVVKAEDSAHSNADKGIACLAVRKDTQTQLAGSDADYGMLQTNATGALRVHNNKVYSSETSIVSGQAVSGSGTHTTSAITNDANITEYLVEHAFSGSDVSYEILEGLTNSGLFVNAQGTSYNSAGSPTSALSMINVIEIKSPFFKVKITNGSGSSRDATMSFVAKTTA